MKKYVVPCLKVAASVGLLGFLFYQAARDESFVVIRDQPKHWPLLLAGSSLVFAAVFVTMLRWWLLVLALDASFRLRDALRLGFLGYLFNFFTLGVLGGDLVRMVFVARHCHRRRGEAAATVVLDRLFGLYGLAVVVSLAYALAGSRLMSESGAISAPVAVMGRVATAAALLGAAAIGVFLLPGFTTSPLWEALERVPRLGGLVRRVVGALRLYRRRGGLLLMLLMMSMAVHGVLACGLFCIAAGLPGKAPSLSAHLVIAPLALLAGAIPVPGGLGAFEAALDLLYRTFSGGGEGTLSGFVVALGYRLVTIVIAMIGMGYYLSDRREVGQLLREARDEAAREETSDQRPLSA